MGIGKRMPYKLPEGMLDQIESNVLKATGCGRKPLRKLRTACITIAAAAADEYRGRYSRWRGGTTKEKENKDTSDDLL